jgi:soluble lytic murein transglycosylase-like protein
VRAVIQVESAWNVRAVSDKGAMGLMQLMPDTALRFGVHNPFDAKENISGGTRYLRFLLDRFHENLKFSLAAYNAGENAVESWGTVPPYAETKTYLKRIEMIYAARQQEPALSARAISRTMQDGRIIYTNVD